MVTDQSTEFQKMFDLIKQIEVVIEPHRANISEKTDFENLKEKFHGHHAVSFSCAILHLNLKPMQHSYSEVQSALRLLKKVFILTSFQKYDTRIFSFLKNSYKINKIIFP